MPPNNVPGVHCMEKALRVTPKGLEVILMSNINVRLGDPPYEREEYLAMELVDRGLVNMTKHFMPKRRYRGAGRWIWSTHREGSYVTGRGYYILSTERCNFNNTGLREPRHGTDHRMILAVIQGEGALLNHCYRRGADTFSGPDKGRASPD